ncbi:GroES-like protein [Cristinia sonorae]|uniref:GroES-like protein n=1 Tax=Cristinia sonorae TaxID=1940300 RepID=A0A8K0XPE7_9AGAR|nr:GroES-like protein [Cristinia sonorae]
MTSIPETHEAVGQLAPNSELTSFRLPTPAPGPDQVLVRVQWSAGSPVTVWIVDFKVTNPQYPLVVGENIVGEVVAIGQGVTDFKVGDVVLSFSFTDEAHGRASQEYALLSKWNVGKLPDNIVPQEAATVPDNLVTAYFTLFDQLGLPTPADFPTTTPSKDTFTPILVWGGGGSVGQYAIQLLRLAGYQNIFAVASPRHHEHLRELGANKTFDYNSPEVFKKILTATGGDRLELVFDTIGDEENSLKPISQLVGPGSKVAYLLPVRIGGHGAVRGVKQTTDVLGDGIESIAVGTKYYQKNERMKRDLQLKIIPSLLGRGLIKPNRYREVKGESLLEKVTEAVDLLRRGAVSGERLVFRVAKT